jgi:hypothetical protein
MSVLLAKFHPTHKRNNNINNNITDNVTDNITDNISETTIMVDASTSASVRHRRDAAVGVGKNTNSTNSNNNNLNHGGDGEGGLSFPLKLHSMLDDADRKRFTDVVAWQQGNKSFKVNDVNRFGNEVMPQYFNQTKFKSFQRQ